MTVNTRYAVVATNRLGGTSYLTEHRKALIFAATLSACNKPEPRQSTLDISVTIGPGILTDSESGTWARS